MPITFESILFSNKIYGGSCTWELLVCVIFKIKSLKRYTVDDANKCENKRESNEVREQ